MSHTHLKVAVAAVIAMPFLAVVTGASASVALTDPCGAITQNPSCGARPGAPAAPRPPTGTSPGSPSGGPSESPAPGTYWVDAAQVGILGQQVWIAFCNGNASDPSSLDTALQTRAGTQDTELISVPGADTRAIGGRSTAPFVLVCEGDGVPPVIPVRSEYPVSARQYEDFDNLWLVFCDGNASELSSLDPVFGFPLNTGPVFDPSGAHAIGIAGSPGDWSAPFTATCGLPASA